MTRDEKLKLARESSALTATGLGAIVKAKMYRSGDWDGSFGVQAALAAIEATEKLVRVGVIERMKEAERQRDAALEAIENIRNAWISNNSEGDDYDAGYDDALKHCHDLAQIDAITEGDGR